MSIVQRVTSTFSRAAARYQYAELIEQRPSATLLVYTCKGLQTIDVRDFNIETPCYPGVRVQPEIKLNVKFKLREQ
jgi:hypothetical protein